VHVQAVRCPARGSAGCSLPLAHLLQDAFPCATSLDLGSASWAVVEQLCCGTGTAAHLARIQRLGLAGTQLAELPGIFRDALFASLAALPGLRALDLSGNRLCNRTLPHHISALALSLTSLGLRGGRFQRLPACLLALTNLRSLDLRPAGSAPAPGVPRGGDGAGGRRAAAPVASMAAPIAAAVEVPAEVGRLAALTSLGISPASSGSQGHIYQHLTGLRELELGGGGGPSSAMRHLLPGISRLQGLQRLGLQDCQRLLSEGLPEELLRLSGLTSLSLAGCARLTRLPHLPPSLLALDVSRCAALLADPGTVPQLGRRAPHLEQLVCLQPAGRRPQLCCLALAAALPSLRSLQLGFCNLQNPEALFDLASLTRLVITGRCLPAGTPPLGISQLSSSLRVLDLSGSGLRRLLPEELGALTGLRLVDLLKSWSDVIAEVPGRSPLMRGSS
jgi:hypothetical protein